jgi:hypothetical protein
MVTGADWQGDVAETVLGVVTVDEATLGLAASSSGIAIITAAATNLSVFPLMTLRILVKGVPLLEWCHLYLAA